jgi:gas vesicle protein
MSKKDDGKIGKKVDRFVMGAILGSAIGSVLGMALAPKKGKDTREIIKEKSKGIIKKGKDLSKKPKDQLFDIVKSKVEEFKDQREMSRMTEVDEEETRKIPHEE